MYSIHASNVSKSIKGKDILIDVSIELNPASIIGLCGHNGSGKTTLLKSLLGLYKCKGTIKNNCNSVKTIFDTPPEDKNLTVYDYLKFFFLLYSGRQAKKSDVLTILDRINLSKCINKKMSTLSFGMKKMVYISTLLIGETSLAIVDEPFNGLDTQSITIVKNLLVELKNTQHATILISSHLLHELESICDGFIEIVSQRAYQTQRLSISCQELCLVCDDNEKTKALLSKCCTYVSRDHGCYYLKLNNMFSSMDIVKLLLENQILFSEIYYLRGKFSD